ncbi:MAG: 6-phosphofructokinase [Tissierellia bacterium]|nr:6-phosphofructokinase [Tissierellia bacterium]
MMRIAILTSGGDAPGMNPAIRAIVRTAIFNKITVYGINNGYRGLIDGELTELNASSVGDIIQRGGTILGTARSEEFQTEEGFQKALNVLDVYNIDGLIVLGGDGSFRGAQKLSEAGIMTIGIPCTIDNDLYYCDYTIGFWTAIETVIEAIGKLRDTSSSHGRANVIEVMGRNSGDLALYSSLAGGGESIIVPEQPVDIDAICRKALKGRMRGKKHNLIIVAEGVGNVFEIAEQMIAKTGIDTRVTVLGHIQRGGTPSAPDRIMGSLMGRRAVELLMAGMTNVALGIKNNEVIEVDINEALEAEGEFNYDIYDTINILSV